MSRLSECSRERELYRYYQPDGLPGNLDSDGGPSVRQSSSDFSLTAFAQLGALRLQAKRGLITLATRNTEYLIAEAGKTQSLQDDNRHDEDDGLWHGVGALSDKTGMALIMLDLLAGAGYDSSAKQHIIIYDLSKDDRFKDLDLVKECPCLRFMACFPIITPGKHVIGFYIVVDDQVREELTQSEIQFLVDMSATVMDHLKSFRVRKKHYRAERMVKALGLFIEGKSSLRDWWVNQGGYNIQLSKARSNLTRPILENQADLEFGVQDPPDGYFAQNLENTHLRTRYPRPPSSPSAPLTVHANDRPSMRHMNSVDSSATTLEASTAASSSDLGDYSAGTGLDSTVATTLDSGISTPYTGVDHFEDTVESLDVTSARKLREALVSADSKRAFARAANLIREGLGLDGAIFYDANVGYFSDSARKTQDLAMQVVTENTAPEATSSSEDDLQGMSNGVAASLEASGLPVQQPSELITKYGKPCQILGFSTRSRSSVNTHSSPVEHASLSEVVLRRLLKRHPAGKVFHFGEDGSFSASESDRSGSFDECSGTSIPPHCHLADIQEPMDKKKKISREVEAAALLKALPGVRSALFYPLWHPSKERWVAGGLIWSTSPMRVLCPVEDMLYMAAFGNSLVAELSRLSALLAAQMKSDFTSSISHELRSPLHGVLASVEFLQETAMTEMQIDMVNTIHACGKTLLDTVNHVLDFSKVNERVKDKSGAKHRSRKPSKSSRMRKMSVANLAEDVEDVSILTEEVIDSVYAGHNIGKRPLHADTFHRRTSSGTKTSQWTLDPTKPLVTVVIDIEWYPNWDFEVDSGALRRILMNIFANSMKYTKSGFVRVSLRTEDRGVSRDGTSKFVLVLTVADSGKGISQEFLKNYLYTPFAQEDSLASGTGLGLSIVRKIVRDLGGTIKFTSEQGVGTEARVVIPMISPKNRILQESGRSVVSEVRTMAKGLKASLLGFDSYPDIMDTPTGILSAEAEAILSLKASVSSMMADWFCMDVITGPGSDYLRVDLHVVLESGITGQQSLEDKIRALADNREDRLGTTTVLVLCNSSSQPQIIDRINGIHVYFLRQPYGPHNLAKVLHQVFCPKTANLQNAELEHITKAPEMPVESNLAAVVASEQNNEALPLHPTIKTDTLKVSFEDIKTPTGPTSNLSDELKVLLVEDNEINLKLLVAFMHKLDLKHATATNGLEALNAYQDVSGKFDVIFMDISMPVMDGLTASREIRQYERRNSIPVTTIIALTGAASMAARQEALKSGIDLFLTKPVPMKKLKKILEDVRAAGVGE